MLPIVLVLLVAASAIAAPQVRINQVGQGDNRARENTVLGSAFQVLDHGDLNVYILTAGQILRDLSRTPGNSAQAFGQGIAAVGELATGRPGDACAAANLINAYVSRVESGNVGGLRNALNIYIQNLSSKIDNIVRLVTNPESVRFASGTRGGCAGEGRSYQFDAAWDSILGNSNQVGLVEEEYCAAKRLYAAFNARSNNVGAQVTASALPITSQVFNAAGGALSNLVQSLASGGNVGQAAAAAKQALQIAVSRVEL